jgi:hypothetical protein
VRAAGVGSAGDDARVAARLLERLHIDVGLHGRVLDVADAPGAMGARAPLRNCCARWRRSVGCFAVFDVSRGVRRASAASSPRAAITVDLLHKAKGQESRA